MIHATTNNRNFIGLLIGISLLTFSILLLVTQKGHALPSTADRYIVVLNESAKDPRAVASEHARSYRAEVSNIYSHALKGYAAKIPAGRLQALQRDPRVAYVEPDGIATTVTTQSSPTWGLDRIDQRSLPLNGTFTYNATGLGVKSYIIDTGIRKSHAEFGGRAIDGFDAVDGALPADDCNGHGTHVAGTTGGNQYGVAKNTTLVAVRVLDCDGRGYWSWIIAGIDFVTASHQPGQSSVANMSLGGGASTAVDSAVRNSIAKGVSYAVAAGNSSGDACRYSPARVAEAMTIGASDKADGKPSWSNWGNCLDWFAPGVGITSAWFTNDSATNTISGTSMASPHAAGAAALYLETNPGATPQQVRDALYNQSTKSVVKKARSINNNLLFTNY